MTQQQQQIISMADELDEAITVAVAAVKAGECIVLPTDTVYGIGADPFSQDAVRGLLDAKRRGEDMPPPVLIAEPSMLRAFTADVPSSAQALAKKFWPGALTLILKAQSAMQLKLGETGNTVAVRVPDHDGARKLLRRTGPLAVSSANISGQPPATTCRGALEQLGDVVRVYLDGGDTAGSTASTIVDFTRFRGGTIVRQGALSYDELKTVAVRLKPLAQPDAQPALEAEAASQSELPVPPNEADNDDVDHDSQSDEPM